MADTTTTVELLLRARDLATGPIDKLGSSLDRLHDHLSRIKDIALGNILGNLGIDGIDATMRGVEDLGKGMIDTNAQIELMRQRLNILYQSTAEGAQAFAFLKQNELTKPFNIQDILGASVQLVAFKQNITAVLPALEDVAGAMGQTLPVAAQAFTDAMSGRFQMMKRDLGISKEELVQFGLQMNKSGHVTDPTSFVTAFLALADSSQFKGGADKMAQTWTGLMSSMSSQWTYFQANIGKGAFDVLEKQLSGVVHTLQSPGNSAAIQNIETQIGAGLAKMTVEALNFGKAIGPYVGSAVALVARAWPLVEKGASEAFNFVGGVVSSFGNWLQSTGYPAIDKVITAIANAWITLEPPVQKVLTALGDDFSNFTSAISTQAGPLLQGLAGAFQIGMGAVQVIFGGSLDLLSGDWANFQNDVNAGTNVIVKGIVEMVGGVTIALLPLATALMGPWTTLAQGVRSVFDGIGGMLGAFIGSMVFGFASLDSSILKTMNSLLRAVGDDLSHIPAFLHPGISDAQVRGMEKGSALGTIDPYAAAAASQKTITDWFTRNAPGINAGQRITPGVTEAQAAANINARTAQILKEMGLGGGLVAGRVYDTKSGPGAAILDQINALFKGLGHGFTMDDLLKSLGLTDIGKGKLSYAPVGSLPVLGIGPTADAAAAGSAAGSSVGATKVPTGRVPLGALGATFMQTLATSGKLGGGTDPATRAAQQQVDGQQTQISQGDKHTQLMQATNEVLTEMRAAVVDTRNFLARLAGPTHTPGNPLTARGVGRPAF